MNRASAAIERHWDWIDDGVLVYGVAALRTLWVWPLLLLTSLALFPGEEALFSVLTIFALLAGGALAVQVSAGVFEGRRAGAIAAAIGLAAVILALYGSIAPPDGAFWHPGWLTSAPEQTGRVIMTVAPAVGLWWWGMTVGRSGDSHDGLTSDFALGLAGMLLVTAISAVSQMIPTSLTLIILLAYLALGLFLLALATIQDARRYESARAGQELPLARHWWGTVAAIVGTLLIVALLLSQLFMPETLQMLAAGVGVLLSLVGQLLIWVVIIISYPIFLILEWLMRLLPVAERERPPLEQPALPNFAEQIKELAEQGAPAAPISSTPFWVVGGALAVALIILLFYLAFRRFHDVIEEDVAEDHESILTLDLLKAQLAHLFRRRGADSGSQPAPFAALQGDDPNVRIRRVYQALLGWAASQGITRAPGMTPRQYTAVLSNAYPAHDLQFGVITAAYDLARYGDAAVTDELARAVVAAWQEILGGAVRSV